MDYAKGEEGAFDRETIVKYASVAIVAVYGIRKGGLIGGLLLSAAASLVTKYIIKTQGGGTESRGQEEYSGEDEAQDQRSERKTPTMA
jgi:hypothetical protein